MNEILILDGTLEIHFDDGRVFKDGIPKDKKLSTQQIRLLQWLLDASPRVASLDNLNDYLGNVYDSWDRDKDPGIEVTISRFNSMINKYCELGKNVTKRRRKGINGYRFNTDIDFKWVQNFSIETLQKDDIFNIPQDSYIEPAEWLTHLYSNAFINKKVHVISGERGIGKTTLARHFASECVKENSPRNDLRFKHVILTSYMEQGLESTITLLKCFGNSEEKENYHQKIKLLKKLSKPALLIIDNYDNQEGYKSELSVESETYKELRDTGCHLLFTSKIDLRDCDGLNQTKLDHLPPEKLNELFFNLSDTDAKKEVVSDLIQNQLMSNTYLVRLAARLTETRSIEEITQAISALELKELNVPINGKDKQERSLFEHFLVLFNLSSFEKNEKKCQLLYNLAMLPLEGIPHSQFFKEIFNDNNYADMQKEFNNLRDSFWVFLNQRKIMMHPIIREITARKSIKFEYNYIKNHIDWLNQQLYFTTYKDDISDMIKRGSAAYEILEKLGIDNLETACLIAKLSSNYDILNNNELAYQYGMKSYWLLEKIDASALDDNGRYKLAQAYNLIGYSILHASHKSDSFMYAEKTLDKADQVIKLIQNIDDTVKRLNTINQGDIAAVYMVKKDYQKALDVHLKNVTLREKLLLVNEQIDNKKLVASAYKGVGTAQFYLSMSQEQEKERLLFDSYRHHALAVKYYEEAYSPEYHFDIAVADNRKVGTLQYLMPYLSDEKKQKFAVDALEKMDRAIKYLMTMQPCNQVELHNSIKNATALIKALEQENFMDGNVLNKYKDALNHTEIDSKKQL